MRKRITESFGSPSPSSPPDPGEVVAGDNVLGHLRGEPHDSPATARLNEAAITIGMPTAIVPAQGNGMDSEPEIELTQHLLDPDQRPDRRLILVNSPDSERAASFRVLRHHLLALGRPQVIVASSARPGDGKTTTALNLALALAECGRAKVLLADTHLRAPQIGPAFRLVPPWCFAEQLVAHRNQPLLPWSLVEIPQLWLHVAALHPQIEQTQLLDAPAFAIAMERLRLVYDHIVVDAPPVLGSADVNLMADAADAVLLAARARRSTARELRTAIDQIGAQKVVGSVLLQ